MTLNPSIQAINTVGNGSLTAGRVLKTIIERQGPTANFTDTLDGAGNFAAALSPQGGFLGSFELTYINNTAYVATIASSVDGTMTVVTTYASAAIPANSVATILIAMTAAGPGVVAAGTATILCRSTAT